MDKVKIIRLMVFVLTFCMVFVLCLLLNKALVRGNEKAFDIKIETVGNIDITDFKVVDNLAYIVTSKKQIYLVDVAKGVYKGSISFKEEQ